MFLLAALACRPPDIQIARYAGYRPRPFCDLIDDQVILQFDRPIDRALLDQALLRQGARVSTCPGRAGCNERTYFLIDVGDDPYGCWRFTSKNVPEFADRRVFTFFPPRIDPCNCDTTQGLGSWGARPPVFTPAEMESLNSLQGAPPDWTGPRELTPTEQRRLDRWEAERQQRVDEAIRAGEARAAQPHEE